jgi:hypothetical protein
VAHVIALFCCKTSKSSRQEVYNSSIDAANRTAAIVREFQARIAPFQALAARIVHNLVNIQIDNFADNYPFRE